MTTIDPKKLATVLLHLAPHDRDKEPSYALITIGSDDTVAVDFGMVSVPVIHVRIEELQRVGKQILAHALPSLATVKHARGAVAHGVIPPVVPTVDDDRPSL